MTSVDNRENLAYAWAVKPRIGIFTRPIDQRTSGSGSHLREIVSTMIDMADAFDIVLCHYEQNHDFPAYRTVEEILLPRNPVSASMAVRRAGLNLVHYNPLTVYSPLFVGKKTRRVATIHGAAPVFLPNQFSTVKVLHERYGVSHLARRMDHLFAVSRTTKDFVSQRFSVPSDRIDVIYNAVDPGFRRLEHAEKEASGFAQLRPFLFHLSKFSERKNPWTILRGFADLAPADPELRLVLGGAGWDNEEVRGFLARRGLGKRAVFPGFLHKQDIVELMNLAEAFVFPSLYEGFGMPNLEAMACGCPVITSRAFAIPEIVGEAAITLENPFDVAALAAAVRRIRRDRELRETLIERGLARAAAFSWEESVRTMLAAYARLLELR